MRLARLLNPRHPLWAWTGAAILGGGLVLSLVLVARGPRPLKSQGDGGDLFGDRALGRQGTITEQLGNGTFELSYEIFRGSQEDLGLQGVKGRLEETELRWSLASPAARRREGRWILDGPLTLEARPPGEASPTGRGTIAEPGPALQWERGAWTGLAPLSWEDLEGQGRGLWTLPRGWRRDLDGRLEVASGTVTWAASREGALRRLEARSLSATSRFEEARMQEVTAELEGGSITTARVDLDPAVIRWFAPIRFRREDGWEGTAERGAAPRPLEDRPLEKIELGQVRARRLGIEGEERLEAEGVRWTTAGLRLEGRVLLEQIHEGKPVRLRAPRLLLREGPGPDLPADLLAGAFRAEGQAVLTWGERSLSSPAIDGLRTRRSWRLAAPVLGRGEDGTFRAGSGQGEPRRWSFEGPIRANLMAGGVLTGDRLLWEGEVWTLLGHPAVWSRLQERLAGPRILRVGERIRFPDGLAGSLSGPEGDLNLKAGAGESSQREIRLTDGIEVRGPDWRLQADRISATLGPGNLVTRVSASGRVTLRGRMGEGTGEALELDLKARTALWKGRVRGRGDLPADAIPEVKR